MARKTGSTVSNIKRAVTKGATQAKRIRVPGKKISSAAVKKAGRNKYIKGK